MCDVCGLGALAFLVVEFRGLLTACCYSNVVAN